MKLTRQDFRIGAIYRFGLKRRLGADQLECLLINRASFKPSYAKRLVAHWMTSDPYRVQMPRNVSYRIEQLPLLTIDGYRTAYLLSGGAEIGYRADGEWWIESIWLDGDRDATAAELRMKPNRRFIEAKIPLPKDHPIYGWIACTLEAAWRGYVQDEVNEALAIERSNYLADLGKARAKGELV